MPWVAWTPLFIFLSLCATLPLHDVFIEVQTPTSAPPPHTLRQPHSPVEIALNQALSSREQGAFSGLLARTFALSLSLSLSLPSLFFLSCCLAWLF